MGKKSFLTSYQRTLFDQIVKNNYIRSKFYFTGGTVLSEYYLRHRYSDDFDFFSETPYEGEVISNHMRILSKKLHFEYNAERIDRLFTFHVTFLNKIPFKVDFSHYEGNRVEKGGVFRKMPIDSLLDIAINKVMCIQQRDQIKDFVDLYFLLKKFTIWDLIDGVKVKFNNKIEPYILGADLMNVVSFTTLPRMIKPLKLSDLQAFFRKEAIILGSKAVE